MYIYMYVYIHTHTHTHTHTRHACSTTSDMLSRRYWGKVYKDQQVTHTHTPIENNTPDTDTHTHDKNNTLNPKRTPPTNT